jgi:hypothetical protein
VCDGVHQGTLLQAQQLRRIAECCIRLDPAAVVGMHSLNLEVAQPQDTTECAQQRGDVLLPYPNVHQGLHHLCILLSIINTINVLHRTTIADFVWCHNAREGVNRPLLMLSTAREHAAWHSTAHRRHQPAATTMATLELTLAKAAATWRAAAGARR